MYRSQEQIISANGVKLWTAVQGHGQPMALCHGGPGAYDYLQPVAEMVDDLCRVVRYDQRGSGRSQVTGPYDVSTFVDDLDSIRRHFGFDRWIVGGHSWGAGLALAYAVRFPAHTRAIIYISGTGIDPSWHDDYRVNRLAMLDDAEREEFQRLRAARGYGDVNTNERIRKRLQTISRKTDVFDERFVDAIPAYNDCPTSEEANWLVGVSFETSINDPEFRQAVVSLSMPMLLIHGSGDPRPARFVEAMSAELSSGHFEPIPDAGHYPWIERPQQVREALRQFIQFQIVSEPPSASAPETWQ